MKVATTTVAAGSEAERWSEIEAAATGNEADRWSAADNGSSGTAAAVGNGA